MSAVLAAAYPIAAERRNDFLVAVAQELARLPVVGDGIVHRVVAETQKRYFDPIDDDGGRHGGKYSRT